MWVVACITEYDLLLFSSLFVPCDIFQEECFVTLGETQALLTGSESCLGVDLPQVFIVISCIGVSGVNSDVHSNDMLVYVVCLFV